MTSYLGAQGESVKETIIRKSRFITRIIGVESEEDAVAAIAARDRGERLEAQILAYPPIDPDCRAGSYHSDPGSFPPPGLLRTAWRSWHGAPQAPAVATDGTRLLLTPREADSLAGVAPAVLVVGGHAGEARRPAEALGDAQRRG